MAGFALRSVLRVLTQGLITTLKTITGLARIVANATKTQPAVSNIIQDKVPQYDHVVIVIMENQNYTDIIGNTTDAPYINNTLLPIASSMTNYFALDHPSLGNYLGLISGNTQGQDGGTDPNVGPPDNLALLTGTNLVDRMEAASVSWKAYMEAMPSNWYTSSTRTMGDTGATSFGGNKEYQEHHNPFVYFSSNNNAYTNTRLTKIVPYTQLATDLAVSGGTGLPKFSWITPQIDHDMHDAINGSTTAIRSGDNWLSTEIPNILTSDAFTKQNSLLILVWDEDNGLSNKVACIATGYNVKKNYTSSNRYDHYSLLRTVEASLGHLSTMQTDPTKNSDLTAAIFSDIFLTSRTQTAIARISKSVTKTLSAIARITANATKTITGISRITALATKTQSAIANIRNTTTRTISALARIQITSIGYVGRALQFDGSQNYVTLGTMGNFGSNLSNGFYASFQIKTTATGAAEFGFGGSYPTQEAIIIAFNENSSGSASSGKLRLYIRDQDGTGLALSGATPATSFNNGQIHTIVMTANFTTKTITISVDGSSQTITYGNTDALTTFVNFPYAFYLGGADQAGTLGNKLACTFDNFQIGTSSSVLYGNYLFDEGTGTTTADSSGKGNTGTLTGTPVPSWVNGLTPLTGLARISVAATKTITAIARITATTTQTIVAKARITALATKTQSAVARMQATAVKTITALARITVSTTKTISAIARITSLATKTQTALARVTALANKTTSAVARIQITTVKTITAISRITVQTTKTVTALARITATSIKTQPGIARITALATKTVSAVARIQVTTTKTITALARISSANTTKTITALARITATALKTITAKARITATTVQTITGISRITIQTTKTLVALARITALAVKTITSVARITANSVKTQAGKARVQISSLQTISAIARITQVVSKTQPGVARITAQTARTISGISRITALAIKQQQAIARIQVFTLRNINALARITDIQIRTITGKANILILTLQIQLGKARMTSNTQRNQTGVARIKSASGLYRRKSSSGTWLGKLYNRLGELYIQD